MFTRADIDLLTRAGGVYALKHRPSGKLLLGRTRSLRAAAFNWLYRLHNPGMAPKPPASVLALPVQGWEFTIVHVAGLDPTGSLVPMTPEQIDADAHTYFTAALTRLREKIPDLLLNAEASFKAKGPRTIKPRENGADKPARHMGHSPLKLIPTGPADVPWDVYLDRACRNTNVKRPSPNAVAELHETWGRYQSKAARKQEWLASRRAKQARDWRDGPTLRALHAGEQHKAEYPDGLPGVIEVSD